MLGLHQRFWKVLRIDGLMDLIIVQPLQALGTLLSETKFIYKTYSFSTFE